MAEYLAMAGHLVVRFNFLYRQAGLERADAPEVLLACLEHVYQDSVARWSLDPARLVVGGKSLGARTAARAVGQGLQAAGLFYLGFPLHPPGRPELSRSELLRDVEPVPQLFLAGTRDPLCPLDRLGEVINNLKSPVQLHVVKGADHSFALPASDPRPAEEVHQTMAEVIGDWLEKIIPV